MGSSIKAQQFSGWVWREKLGDEVVDHFRFQGELTQIRLLKEFLPFFSESVHLRAQRGERERETTHGMWSNAIAPSSNARAS